MLEISVLRCNGEHILKIETEYEEIGYEEIQENLGFLPGSFPLSFELWQFEILSFKIPLNQERELFVGPTEVVWQTQLRVLLKEYGIF